MDDQERKPQRFFSLKLKWAFGTAIGSLIISLIVVVTIFSSFTNDLLNQERASLKQSLVTISRQLKRNPNQHDLTRATVSATLQKKILDEQQKSYTDQIYHRPVLQGLSDADQNVAVFNAQGKLLFQTGKVVQKFQKSSSERVVLQNWHNHKMIVGWTPVRDSKNQRTIGYVQIENPLINYYHHYHHLLLIVGLALCLVVIFSGLLGYGLSYILLRPLNDIGKTLAVVTKDPTKDVRAPETNRNDELGELSRLLNEMLDRTQRYIDQQSQFVGDVSHELRTPVAIIQGHMEMLERWGKDDPKVLEDSIRAALAETSRMNNLVQEMLDLSRAEQVEIKFRDATTKVEEVVEQVYNNFQMIHPDFQFTLDDDLRQDVEVSIYRDHLEQILIILCDNAVKYSTDRKEIHLSLSRNYNSVEIAVQDFGEGIAPEDVERVFDRFYRVDKARSRKKGGNGLGLSIAERLVKGYRGTITLESQVGAGSIFRITLPIVKHVHDNKD
ncbi:HAMP domain-containing histidine kinase [uncultured Limosilactobacillus sp.]|uniref:HAMP domain-containing sensor histidine kinase n=1 Tax=uncultured Limosilactobacillus sp. TaxID=2837629 RepID=UPI0025D28AAD|nr:HAMP domain-containing histidine kinase [uncultured Limosilactobacillus sp.]